MTDLVTTLTDRELARLTGQTLEELDADTIALDSELSKQARREGWEINVNTFCKWNGITWDREPFCDSLGMGASDVIPESEWWPRYAVFRQSADHRDELAEQLNLPEAVL